MQYLMLVGLLAGHAGEHGRLLEMEDDFVAGAVRAHSQRALVGDDQVPTHQPTDV